MNLFGFVIGKQKYWNDLCRKNEILAYLVTKFDKWED